MHVATFKNISGEFGGGGGSWGSMEAPFGLNIVLRSTDDKLNGTPLSGQRSKKTAAVAHLSMA